MKKIILLSLVFNVFSHPLFSQMIKEVKIGSQIWMAENLNVEKFRNGDPITQIKTDAEWVNAGENKQPAWCYYNNNSANGSKYCKLYNWYAVNDPRGIAPEGWHVSSNTEWMQLINNQGENDGMKMKNKKGWKIKNKCTNTTGFSGFPGGFRNYLGEFHTGGETGYWWTSTESDTENAKAFFMAFDLNNVPNYSNYKTAGLSVRCIKD